MRRERRAAMAGHQRIVRRDGDDDAGAIRIGFERRERVLDDRRTAERGVLLGHGRRNRRPLPAAGMTTK